MQLEQRQWVRLATVAILVLVLGAGFLVGAAWDRRLDAETVAAVPDSTSTTDRNDRDGGRTPIYVRVSPSLSAAQLTAAEAIVARRREAAEALFAEPGIDSLYDAMKSAEHAFKAVYDPRFAALVDSSRNAIKQVMTPVQAARYDSLLAENDRRRRADRGEGPR